MFNNEVMVSDFDRSIFIWLNFTSNFARTVIFESQKPGLSNCERIILNIEGARAHQSSIIFVLYVSCIPSLLLVQREVDEKNDQLHDVSEKLTSLELSLASQVRITVFHLVLGTTQPKVRELQRIC